MRPYTRGAILYLRSVILAGVGLLALAAWLDPQGLRDWRPLLILAACGATAHLYPVRSAQLKARYVVANIFVFAAVLLLSPLGLAIFSAVVMLPHTVRNWRPRILDGYAFNSAQTLIAALASYGLVAVTGGPDFQSAAGLAVLSAAALLFTGLQGLLVGVVIALNGHLPLHKTDTLQPLALMADATLPFLGIVVAVLWQASPWALAAVHVPVLIAYKLIRQVHLVQHSDVEPKTELFTYRYFQSALRDELNRSTWGKRPLSVIFADMDYLRDVNNTWGHLAGDEVLKQLAAILRSHTRPGEVAARFGGEEFVLMLPGVDAEEAAYRAEKIRAGVAGNSFCIGGGRTITCTISLGVACTADVGRDPEVLVDKADEALYQAKARGRNQVARAGVAGPALHGTPAEAALAAAAAVMPPAGRTQRTLRRVQQEVEAANAAQQRTVEQLIVMISAIIDARDNSTYGHSRQVANYAVAIGREMDMPDAEIETLRTAALLHDLGKVGVPEAILKKPARLTPEEYAIIKEHAALGERILAEVEELGPVARAVGEHHERYDGTGYPLGKAGESISLAGRILAVADTLDSILSDRPYSRARSLEVALAELRRCSGQQFDPRVVAVALRLAETLGPGAFINSAAVAQIS